MANETVIEKLNQYLLETESLANDFLPLKDKLAVVKADMDTTLNNLKSAAENSRDLSDKVFYLKRYTDLIKSVEGIFDTRSRRIQSCLNVLSKLALTTPTNPIPADGDNEGTSDGLNLTPEQCAKIFAVLQDTQS